MSVSSRSRTKVYQSISSFWNWGKNGFGGIGGNGFKSSYSIYFASSGFSSGSIISSTPVSKSKIGKLS